MKYNIERINGLYHLLDNKGYTIAISLTPRYLKFINNKNVHTKRREEESLRIVHDLYKDSMGKTFFIEFYESKYSNIAYDQVFVKILGIGVVKKYDKSYIRVLLEKRIEDVLKVKKEYYTVSIHSLPYNGSNFIYNMLTSSRYNYSTLIDNVEISPLKYLVIRNNRGKSFIKDKKDYIFS